VLRTLQLGDLILRYAFFAIAPFTLVIFVTLLPVMGVVINMVLALLVFALAAQVRRASDRYPLVGKALGKQLSFETFYTEHPPKPFLFYVFYPLMLPYVAFNKVAQKELALYRGLTSLGFVLLFGGALWDFFRKWQPEIGFLDFGKKWAALLLIQAVLSIIIVMPMTTTIIALRMQKRVVALTTVLIVGAWSTAAAIFFMAQRRHDIVQLPTMDRMVLRTKAAPDKAREVQEKALKRALISIRRGDAETFKNPKATEIFGGPIIDARDSLLGLYKEDETRCFHLIAFKKPARGVVLVLFGLANKANKIVWLGINKNEDFIDDLEDLPDGALNTMARIGKK
jgi:hypothetical protein